MRANPALDRAGAHPIAAIQQRAREMREAGQTLIDFSIGDPREPTPDAIRAAVAGAVPVISRYPTTAGLPELRTAIAGYVQRRFAVRVDPDSQVLVSSGSKEAIFSTALAFVDRDRGEAVGFPDPGYPVYSRGAALAGARPVPIRTDASTLVSTASVPTELWPDLALLWLCSPSNPTGAVTSIDSLTELVARARHHDVLLASDECYVDLYDDPDRPPPSVLEAAGEGSVGVLSYLSLSKRSGMTGYRSGAIVGDAGAIERLHRLRTSTGTAPTEFVQAGAVVAWSDDEHVAERRAVFATKRAVLRKALEGAGATVVESRAGLYLWVATDEDDVALTRRVLSSGVVVSPGSIFGSGGVGHIRLALVPTLTECEQAGEILASLL
jgi:succinyldiaminopimelate transaminase